MHSGKLDYECPNCNGKNKIILMGEQNGTFEKICKTCNSKLEVTLKDNEINILIKCLWSWLDNGDGELGLTVAYCYIN